jgi:hypothetical protein
VQQVP